MVLLEKALADQRKAQDERFNAWDGTDPDPRTYGKTIVYCEHLRLHEYLFKVSLLHLIRDPGGLWHFWLNYILGF